MLKLRWPSDSISAAAAARIGATRNVPVWATYAVRTGKAPHAAAKVAALCRMPPNSSRL